MVTQLPDNGKIRLAVVTGGHPFDVPGFRALFDQLPDVDPYIQDVDNWARSPIFDQYDAFLFFNMHAWGINSVRKDMDDRIMQAIERLGESEQGVFVWHHALLAWPEVEAFSDVCNEDGRRLAKFEPQVELQHTIANPDHPITQGLEPFTVWSEGFLIGDAREGSDVLLTTDQPISLKTLAWTHQYKNARVFCYQVGHDAETWNETNVHTILHRGIQWVAKRI